ncbi:MAG: TonB-dependent receptor [Tannerellaceae bacterium]|nr:TonB-dependent receptor [Tannerellaceae bacterium]
MSRKLLTLLPALLCLSLTPLWAQQGTITGTVTDTDNFPVIGATVMIKGTTTGTTTDLDGFYSLTASTGDIIVFSYVGMQQQEIRVGTGNVINVKLLDGELLDEVVVIGYGTVKKSDLTGAVSSVSSKDLQADVARNAASALQGRIAGVSVSSMGGQPGKEMNINIRGLSSLDNNAPLYVIDGVYGDLNMIDPADIASMEILKDAAAAAIYGSRAANGVVLITTKGGRREMPTQVNVNAYSGIQSLPKRMDVMDAQQWIGFMTRNGYDLPGDVRNFQGKGTNWQDEVFRTAPITKANIAISGGTKTATYNVSASYLNQSGIIKETGYDAFNIRTKNTFSFFEDRLRIGNTFIIKTWHQTYTDLTITDILRQLPMVPVYDENRTAGFGGTEDWMHNMENPYGYLHVYDKQKWGTDILLNAYAELDLGLKGLKYKLNVGINKNNQRDYQYTQAHDFGRISVADNQLTERSDWEDQWMVENTLHYDNTFGKHTVSGLLGYSAQKYNDRFIKAGRNELMNGTSTIKGGTSGTQSTDGEANENALVSLFGRVMYSYDSRYMISASIRRDGSSRFADGHRYGVFPSVSVGWNIMNENFFNSARKVVNELKIRGSYGVLGNQEIGNYRTQRTVRTGVNYTQGSSWWQGGMSGINWVSPENLTWEETSTFNAGVDMSFLNGRINFTADVYTQETKNILLDVNMPLSAGKDKNPTMNAGTITNKGLEMSLTHRNTIGDIYYHIGANVATVSNKIKEITVGDKFDFEGFNPRGEGPVTWNRVGYAIGSFFLIQTDGIFQSEAEVNAHKDKDGNLIQPKAQPGDIRYIDANGDGKISIDDKVYAGSPFPDFTFGIRGGVAWKGADLNFFFDGMAGNKIYNYTRVRMEAMDAMHNYSTSVLGAWTESNRNNTMPRYTADDANENSNRSTDRWLEKGDYIRLKTLEIGYSLPKQVTNKIHLQNVRIYTAMDNLFTITGYKGYSPDLGDVGQEEDIMGGGKGVATRGTDYGRYPSARTITFGVQLDF